MDPGIVGAIVGIVIGIVGGVTGTYFSIRNSTRPRELSIVIPMAFLFWLWLTVFVAGLLCMPRPWNQGSI
jgi:hypothetical protein